VVGAVGSDDEGSDAARHILRRDIDGDVAGIGRRMTRGDDEAGGVRRIGRAEGAGVAGDAGKILTVGGENGDFGECALRNSSMNDGFGWRSVRGTENEVAVFGGDGNAVVGEIGGRDITRRVWVADGRRCVCGCLGDSESCGGAKGEYGGGAEEVGHGRLRVLRWLAAAGLNVYPRRLTIEDIEA